MKQKWQGNEDFQNESNERGIISGSFYFTWDTWRDYCEEVWFELHKLNDKGDTWDVSAVITKSECKRFSVGDIVTFELPKDISIDDLGDEVKEQFIQEYQQSKFNNHGNKYFRGTCIRRNVSQVQQRLNLWCMD